MTVYVDDAKNKLGRMLMSHMIADSLDELHEMAVRIGLRREWFQSTSLPHYDVSQSKRMIAVKFGAILVTRRELVRIARGLEC